MVTRRQLLATAGVTAAGTVLGSLSLPGTARADYATTINPYNNSYAWDGWGASLSWWAGVFGMNDTLADMFYTLNTVPYAGGSYPGLGLNIVRYNVGACSWEKANGAQMAVSTNIKRYKQMEGYWLDWNSNNPASSSWNWWKDSNQRNMLWKARDRGIANQFEMFSASPMWWMCSNLNPSGAQGGGNNLQSWNYNDHARYLATVAKYAHDNWGVNFSSVEAFNEPSASWWKDDGTQEGCHIDSSIQDTIIGYLRSELDARGLTGTIVSASDEYSYSQATTTWNSSSLTAQAQVGRVNVHGYEIDPYGNSRLALRSAAGNKKVWQTEYGENYSYGMIMAIRLALDLRFLCPTAWCYWQPVSDGGWGLVEATYNPADPKLPALPTGTLGGVNNKYFVLAQFTRHIRQHMLIIDSGDPATVAAYDTTNKRLVLVTVMPLDSPQNITYDLSRFSAVGGAPGGVIRSWTTEANPSGTIGQQYVAGGTTGLNGKHFTAYFPAYSIQTFEIDNVTM